MNRIRVIIPTIYDYACPTIRSRLYPLCHQLSESGFEFTFLVFERDVPRTELNISFRSYRNFRRLVRMVWGIRKSDYDLVLACKPYSLTGVLSYFVARFRGLGYVLDVDDRIFPSEINKWWRLPLYIHEWCMERLLMWVKPTTTVASDGLKRYWGRHVTYIANTVDLKFFPGKTAYSVNRVSHGIPEKGIVIIWPAVFFQETDRRYILDIFEKLQQKNKTIVLWIIGDGKYLPDLKKRATLMGLLNVIFAGPVAHEHMASYYACADAGILPLRNNQYDDCKGPIKLFEYMAMELPIIATPVGEPNLMIENVQCGIVIPFDDSAAAAEKIDALCSNPAEMERMGENGRRYLEKSQNFEKQAAALKNVLLSVIH